MEPYTITPETLLTALWLALFAFILPSWLALIIELFIKPKIKKFLSSEFWFTFSIVLQVLKYPFFVILIFSIFYYLITS
jgi:hypothetical protein